MITAWMGIVTAVVVVEGIALVRVWLRERSTAALPAKAVAGAPSPEPLGTPQGSVPFGTVIGRPWQIAVSRARVDPSQPNVVTLLASVRSVSAHHVVDVVARLNAREPSPVLWRCLVAGSDDDVARFGAGLPCIAVEDEVVVGAGAAGHPVAVYVGDDGLVAHAGPVWNMASLLTLIEACPAPELRQWFARSAAGDVEMSRHNDVGRRAPVSPNNVLDHWGSMR